MTYTPVETWRALAAALQRTGMTGDEAALVMGGNMLRVARQVWLPPAPMTASGKSGGRPENGGPRSGCP
jgi:hypothetical protein